MVVYKAYDKKLGWTRDYKRENGKLLFNFGDGYIKTNDYCIGFEMLSDLSDGDRNIKQVNREKQISDIFDEDYGFLYTKHLYKYPKNFKVSYYELEEPYFYIDYNKGVFMFDYYYNGAQFIPISYVDDISGQYIDLELLEMIGNKFEDSEKCRELWLKARLV